MSEGARRVANRIIRLYPRPWRERYADEMRTILDEIPVHWRQTADLAAGAIREWLSPRAFGWPARSAAGRIQFVRGFKYFAVAYALDGVARFVAWKLDASDTAIPSSFASAAEWAFYAGAFRFLATSVLTWRKRWRMRFPRLSVVTGFEIALWCLPYLGWLVVQHTEPIPAWVRNPNTHYISEVLRPYIWASLPFQVSVLTRRLSLVRESRGKRLLGNAQVSSN